MKRMLPIAFATSVFLLIWSIGFEGSCNRRTVIERTSGTLLLELKYRAWKSEFDVAGAFEIELTNLGDEQVDHCSVGLDRSFARLSYLDPLRSGPIRSDSIGPGTKYAFQFSHDTNNFMEYDMPAGDLLPQVVSVRCDEGYVAWKVPKLFGRNLRKIKAWSNAGESSNEERLKDSRGLILEPNANYVPGAYPMRRGRLEDVFPTQATDENGSD